MATDNSASTSLTSRLKRGLLSFVRTSPAYDLASYGLFGIVAVLILATFHQYGITWDEPLQDMYGADIVRYYFLLVRHAQYVPPVDHAPNLTLYGGLFDTLVFPVNLLFRKHIFEARHLLNALVGLFGIVGCWRLGRFVGGAAVGFWAALLLAIMPRFYGGMFNNPKDIPFAVGYVWSIYFILRFVEKLPEVPRGVTIKLGIAIGATLAMRIGGLLLFAYLGMAIVIWFAARLLKQGFASGVFRELRHVFVSCLQATCIAWLLMLVFWPWAQVHPLTRPFEALTKFSHYSDWKGFAVYNGAILHAAELPRGYIIRWLWMTLPELVLVGLAIGLVYFIWYSFARLNKENFAGLWKGALLSFATVFPVAYIVFRRSVVYNGERHVTFVLPLLACLAAWGGYRAVESLNPGAQKIAAACVLAYLVFHVGTMARLHPDEYVYFNQFVGGLKAANGLYETDYYGNSYREAVGDLKAYVAKSPVPTQDGKYKIFIKYAYPACVSYYFPKNFSLTTNPEEADFFIANTSFRIDQTLDGRVIAKVERFGVPLAVVKELPAAEAHRLARNSSENSF
jgi:hypothetical protein